MEHLQNWGIRNNQEIYKDLDKSVGKKRKIHGALTELGIRNNQEIYKDVRRYISGNENENVQSTYRTGELEIIRKYISMYVDTSVEMKTKIHGALTELGNYK